MVYSRLKKIRMEKGITQEELSRSSKVGRSTISDIENGRYMCTIDSALRISKALDTPVEEIFYLDA